MTTSNPPKDVQASTIPDFSPPGDLPDFDQATKALWSSDYIAYWVNGEINATPAVVSPGRTPLKQFFNGTVVPFNNNVQTAVTWNAFPKLVTTAYKTTPLRWQVADASRMFQDEYLEWSVARNGKKEIVSVTFTCEGPEYWQVYASYQRDDFIKTMRTMNSDFSNEMSDGDFFLTDPKTGASVYNPNNYWNQLTTTGTIAHLVQPNNTLSAEIDIAAQATVIRKDSSGNVVTDPNQLILCSGYGNPGRNSDPTIGATINQVARQGVSLSVANPIALYIHDFDTTNFMYDPTGTQDPPPPRSQLKAIDNPDQVFVFQRHGLLPNGNPAPNQGLRLQVKIPDGVLGSSGQQLNVSNIVDISTNKHIRYGAQFADHVTMSVSAVSVPATEAAPIPCYDPSATSVAADTTSTATNGVSAVTESIMSVLGTKDENMASKVSTLPKSVNRKGHTWVE